MAAWSTVFQHSESAGTRALIKCHPGQDDADGLMMPPPQREMSG
jgi:hypothetical protein